MLNLVNSRRGISILAMLLVSYGTASAQVEYSPDPLEFAPEGQVQCSPAQITAEGCFH